MGEALNETVCGSDGQCEGLTVRFKHHPTFLSSYLDCLAPSRSIRLHMVVNRTLGTGFAGHLQLFYFLLCQLFMQVK